MKLDGLSFDQDRLKCLHPETVKGRGAIQYHGIFFHDLVKGIPYFRGLPFHHFFCALYSGNIPFCFKTAVNKRLKEFQGHLFGKSALMQAESRSNHNNRSSGIVDPLSQKILAKSSLFSLEHVAK